MGKSLEELHQSLEQLILNELPTPIQARIYKDFLDRLEGTLHKLTLDLLKSPLIPGLLVEMEREETWPDFNEETKGAMSLFFGILQEMAQNEHWQPFATRKFLIMTLKKARGRQLTLDIS